MNQMIQILDGYEYLYDRKALSIKAMVAGAILVFSIPLMNERKRLLNLTWLKLKLIMPIIIMAAILAVVLIPILESTGLLDRFMWFYKHKGVIGIVLSGRDEFVVHMVYIFEYY